MNRPCEVKYEVAVFGAGGGKIAAGEVKEPTAMLTGLRDGLTYDVTVTARTNKGRSPPTKASTSPLGRSSHLNSASSLISGNFGLVPATRQDWTCSPKSSVSICPAAASRLCNPMTCTEVAKRGLCDASFMRQTDWQKRQVTQFCSGECGCAAHPTLRQTLAGPRADACCAIQTAEYFQDENGRSTNGIDKGKEG
ncbi:hypothetical protein NADE_003549 [Nannochloris sp. 'desiccata']|nr:hypothetical protein KSW81_000426 [Chlorella desiccata (nom. nud.)]KAH7620940.1 hypothetical protein NADE_003549 [Chlorella desiccata (nom. nud.)]